MNKSFSSNQNNSDINNNSKCNNLMYQKALEKIACDSQNKPCCCSGII